jgi:hypothetical protein
VLEARGIIGGSRTTLQEFDINLRIPAHLDFVFRPMVFGVSQRGLLHFGQTRGFSALSRGNHS